MSDLNKLRETAEAATQGGWSAELLNDFADATHINGPEFASANTFDSDDEAVQTRIHANALHIATFDPPTALLICDVLEAAKTVARPGSGIADKAILAVAFARLERHLEGDER